jgi:hypothetical protein
MHWVMMQSPGPMVLHENSCVNSGIIPSWKESYHCSENRRRGRSGLSYVVLALVPAGLSTSARSGKA